MSLFAPLSALLASKAGTAAAAGLAVATATAGVATAAAVLPDDADPDRTAVEQDDDSGNATNDDILTSDLEGEQAQTDGDGTEDVNLLAETDDESGEPDEAGLENRSDTANRVQEVVAERDSYESGREFGAAVSSAASGDDGEDDAPGAHGRDRADEARGESGRPADDSGDTEAVTSDGPDDETDDEIDGS